MPAMVTARASQIVAMGGGGFSMEPGNPLLDDYVLSLIDSDRARVCFLPTASGDSDSYITRFYTAFGGGRCDPTHLPLFPRVITDLRAFVLAADIIYVGGGATANMLAVWRVHGLDAVLREAYEAGVVLAGLSAGSVCWFEACVTDSFGPLARMDDGLGLLPGSHCPHYDSERQRRPTYHRCVAEGMPGGYAADDGAALHFVDGALVRVVTSRPEAAAYHVELVDGEVIETPLETHYLGDVG